jgi:hypothetical protein
MGYRSDQGKIIFAKTENSRPLFLYPKRRKFGKVSGQKGSQSLTNGGIDYPIVINTDL